MTTGRELVPAQTVAAENFRSPSRGDLLRLLRRLRALCEDDEAPQNTDALRAYGSSDALSSLGIAHRVDLRL